MSWELLLSNYTNFIVAINDTKALSFFTSFTFEKPENYPSKLMKDVELDFRDIRSKEREYLKLINKGEDPTEFIEDLKKNPMRSPFTIRRLESMFYSAANPDFKIHYTNILGFKGTHLIQEFIIYYVLLEAYIKDILRIIIAKKPTIITLPKDVNKEFTYTEIIRNRNQILEMVIERKVYGWKSFEDYMDFLTKKAKYKFERTANLENFLTQIEQIRHCIVHNGGRISSDFKDKITIKGLKLVVGDVIPINPVFNTEVFNFVRQMAYNLFIQTSTKFFKKEWENAKSKNYYVKFISDQLAIFKK